MFKAIRTIRQYLRATQTPEYRAHVRAEREKWEGVARQQAATPMTLSEDDMDAAAATVRRAMGSMDMTALLPPPSEFVKRTSCAACGGVKELPSVRPTLYCDFCGQVTDYDLKQAMAEAYSHPDVIDFARVGNRLRPAAMAAGRAGDVDRFRSLTRTLVEAQTAFTPWTVPPRAYNDEGYRRDWIRYQTELQVLTTFDPTHAALENRMVTLTQQLRWTGGNLAAMGMQALMGRTPGERTRPRVVAETFWPLVDVLLEQAERTRNLLDGSPVKDLDPDRMPGVVADRLFRSGLAQGWLPSLEPDEGERFVRLLQLDMSYTRPTASGDHRHCTGCGHDLTVLEGATTVVCDRCGRRVDVTGPAITCTGCNDRVALPESVQEASCPSCNARVRRV